MKKLIFSRQAYAGVITAWLTGFTWMAVFQHFGHMSASALLPWILPLALLVGTIGLTVGMIGKRKNNSLIKVIFSALAGTGTGAFSVLPLTGMVLYPLGKLAEWLGLIPRAAIPTEVTSALVIVAMIVVWMLVGTGIGSGLLLASFRSSATAQLQGQAPDHGL